MLIVCPGCATSYRIDAEALGPVGRTVRCARCRSTWFAAAAIDTLSAEPEIVAEGAPSERGREQRQADGAPIDAGAAGESLHDPSPLPAAEDTAIARIAEGAQAEPRQGAGEAASTSEPASAPIVEAPPLVPAAGIAPPAGDPPAEPEDIESFAARRERLQARRRQRRRTSRWAAALLVLFAVNVALIEGARTSCATCRKPPRCSPRSACRSICAISSSGTCAWCARSSRVFRSSPSKA